MSVIDAYHQLVAGLGILVLSVVGSALWLGWIIFSWSRPIGRLRLRLPPTDTRGLYVDWHCRRAVGGKTAVRLAGVVPGPVGSVLPCAICGHVFAFVVPQQCARP
jgi:hypothetical protein